MTEAATLLRVESLCSGYGSLQVLFEVSFDVRAGEVVALMGSNGAGKTTTLRTITGQLKVLKGSVHLADDDVDRRAGRAARAPGPGDGARRARHAARSHASPRTSSWVLTS